MSSWHETGNYTYYHVVLLLHFAIVRKRFSLLEFLIIIIIIIIIIILYNVPYIYFYSLNMVLKFHLNKPQTKNPLNNNILQWTDIRPSFTVAIFVILPQRPIVREREKSVQMINGFTCRLQCWVRRFWFSHVLCTRCWITAYPGTYFQLLHYPSGNKYSEGGIKRSLTSIYKVPSLSHFSLVSLVINPGPKLIPRGPRVLRHRREFTTN